MKSIAAAIGSLVTVLIGLYVGNIIADKTYEATDKIAESTFANNEQLTNTYETVKAVDEATGNYEDVRDLTYGISKVLLVVGLPAATIGGFVLSRR